MADFFDPIIKLFHVAHIEPPLPPAQADEESQEHLITPVDAFYAPPSILRFLSWRPDTIVSSHPELNFRRTNGRIEVETKLTRTVADGVKALNRLAEIMEINVKTSDDGLRRFADAFEEVDRLTEAYQRAAHEVRETYLEGGTFQQRGTEYYSNLAWHAHNASETLQNSQPPPTDVDASKKWVEAYKWQNTMMLRGVVMDSNSISIPVAIVGFNMTAINKVDPTYKAGDLARDTIRREIIEKFGVDAVSMYGNTKFRIIGFSAEVISRKMHEIRREVIKELSRGRRGRSVDWTRINLGLSVGIGKHIIEWEILRAGVPEYSVHHATLDAVGQQAIAERKTVVSGEIEILAGRPDRLAPRSWGFQPELTYESPVLTRMDGDTRTEIDLGKITDIEKYPEIRPEEFVVIEPPELRIQRMARPAHGAGRPYATIRSLKVTLEQMRLFVDEYRRGNMTMEGMGSAREQLSKLQREAGRILSSCLFGRNGKVEIRSARQELVDIADESARDIRMPEAFRMSRVVEEGQRFLGGRRGWLVMAELKGFKAFNMAHPPDVFDSYRNMTVEIVQKGFLTLQKDFDVDLMIGIRGDEYYIIVAENKGTQLTEATLQRKAAWVQGQLKRIFSELKFQEQVKIPMRGGEVDNIRFATDDKTVYVEKTGTDGNILDRRAAEERVRAAAKGFGIEGVGAVKFVDKVARLGAVERLLVWSRMTQAGTQKLYEGDPRRAYELGFSPHHTTLEGNIAAVRIDHPGRIEDLIGRVSVAVDVTKTDANNRPHFLMPYSWGENVLFRSGSQFIAGGAAMGMGDLLSDAALAPFFSEYRKRFTELGALKAWPGMVAEVMGGAYAATGATRAALNIIEGRRFYSTIGFLRNYVGPKGYILHAAALLGGFLGASRHQIADADFESMAINSANLGATLMVSTLFQMMLGTRASKIVGRNTPLGLILWGTFDFAMLKLLPIAETQMQVVAEKVMTKRRIAGLLDRLEEISLGTDWGETIDVLSEGGRPYLDSEMGKRRTEWLAVHTELKREIQKYTSLYYFGGRSSPLDEEEIKTAEYDFNARIQSVDRQEMPFPVLASFPYDKDSRVAVREYILSHLDHPAMISLEIEDYIARIIETAARRSI